jgi:hypothetical protein
MSLLVEFVLVRFIAMVTQVTGIILILLSIGILIYWLATGRRSKPLLKFVCVFIAIMGFLVILKDKLVEVTFKDWLSIKTSVAEASADAKTIASIKQQVENQRATIDLVATEAQTAKKPIRGGVQQNRACRTEVERFGRRHSEGK